MWLTTPDLDPIADLGSIPPDGEATGTTVWDQLMVVVSREPADLESGGERWTVGIQDPRNPHRDRRAGEQPIWLNALAVADRAVVTSGHYERFTEIEGKRYSHILDPTTGRPVRQKLASVTVIAPTCAMADGLATAVAVMGPADGMKLIERLEDTEALLYLDDGPDEPLRPVRSTGLAALETD